MVEVDVIVGKVVERKLLAVPAISLEKDGKLG